ncbi:MAG: RNA polymerase sigma factor [Actinomycetia bacterium]|nr:RNA polymerase sigma factor [Actinomycetes bacterium]
MADQPVAPETLWRVSPVGVGGGIGRGEMGTGLSVGEAFAKWSDDLTRYATVLVGPDDAGDIVNQAFASVLAARSWDTVSSHKGYLYRSTLNAARAQRRSQGRRDAREWRHGSTSVEHWDLLADPAVVAAVNGLSLRQRAVVYLTYWEDMTPQSIAADLAVSEGTVRRQLARARARLRKVLL